ncbi:MAG: lipopolysaccharide heptosyltransferase II [Acidobacteriaceae bacterium]|nr:lipopolysaccharide heptosyltransferase II [Acidobacteriaceae bacterium]
MQFNKILVRATNWLGDAVMSIPALQALRECFPSAHIAILARPWVASLYGREPFCDELIGYEAPKGWRGLREKRELASQLKRREFDCAVLFQNAFEAAATARGANIPVRIGYARDGRSLLLTHAIRTPLKGETPQHQRFYYLELLKRAGVIDRYPLDKPIVLHGSVAAAENGRKLLLKAGLTQPVIGISPGAAYGGAKRWLPQRFAEAAVHLARERRGAVAVFGSREEQEIAERVRESVAARDVKCMNLAGSTALADFIHIAAACDLFLTNDSGPMHVASALGVPTVAIFGATDDEATGPTGLHSRVVREPVECSPCLLRECPIDHRCMTRVTAERVAAAANTLVGIGKA